MFCWEFEWRDRLGKQLKEDAEIEDAAYGLVYAKIRILLEELNEDAGAADYAAKESKTREENTPYVGYYDSVVRRIRLAGGQPCGCS